MPTRPTPRTLAIRAALLSTVMLLSVLAVPLAGVAPLTTDRPDTTTTQSIPSEATTPALAGAPHPQVTPPTPERGGVDAVLQPGRTRFAGQTLGATIPEAVSDADTVSLRRHDPGSNRAGSFVREVRVDDDGALTIGTASLDGKYLLVPEGDRSQAFRFDSDGVATELVDVRDARPFEVAQQSLRVEWGQDRITTNDDDVQLDIRSNRARYNLNVSADGLTFEDLENLLRAGGAADNPDPYEDRQPFAVDGVVHDAHADEDVLVVRGFGDGSLTADFTEIAPGDYRFTFEVTDTGVTSGAPVGDGDDGDDDADAPEPEPDPSFFNVTDLDPATATVTAGDPLTVSATVTNIGGTADTQPVELRIGNDTVATEEATLEPDDRETVTFEVDAPAEPGTYIHAVHTANASLTGELVVEAADQPDHDDDADVDDDAPPEGTDDADDAPPEGTDDEAPADDDAPGFGVLVALIALVAATLLVIRNRR